MSKKPRYLNALTVGLCGGILAMFWTTGHMYRGGDAIRYDTIGRHIAQGQGFVTSIVEVPLQDATPRMENGLVLVTMQPPGMPLFFALSGGTSNGARLWPTQILNAACLALLAGMLFSMALRVLHSVPAALAVVLLTLSSPYILRLTNTLLADIPFLTCYFGAVYLLVLAAACRTQRRETWCLVAASSIAALALLFRYPALALLPVFAAGVVFRWLQTRDAHRTFSWCIHALTVFAVTVVVLLGRNYYYTGGISGFCNSDRPIPVEVNYLQGFTFSAIHAVNSLKPSWIRDVSWGVSARVPVWINFLVFGGAMMLIAGLFMATWRRPVPTDHQVGLEPAKDWFGWAMVAVAYACYFGFFVHTGRGAQGLTEPRYFAPLVPFAWLIILRCVQDWSWRRHAVWLLLLVGGVSVTFDVAQRFRNADPDRGQLAHPEFADFLQQQLPETTVLLTNGQWYTTRVKPNSIHYGISHGHPGYALPTGMRSERALTDYFQDRRIEYLVLRRDEDEQGVHLYFGDFLVALMQSQIWEDRRVYEDDSWVVYRTLTSTSIPK